MTPLHYAAVNGHLSIVEVLIRSNADVNAVDKVSQYITMHVYNITVHVQIAITYQHLYLADMCLVYFICFCANFCSEFNS